MQVKHGVNVTGNDHLTFHTGSHVGKKNSWKLSKNKCSNS